MKQYFSMAAAFIFCVQMAQAQIANRFDIVIDELMIDPSPPINLPNAEWVELRNTSATPINLVGYRLGNASAQSGAMPNYILKPDSFVIVCTSSAVSLMTVYGPTIAVTNFPSLNNSGDIIYLKSPQNKIIHAVNYTDAWYQNELKKNGGWTLEMIDTKNPCSGYSNWKASTNPNGGTPGKINSVDAVNADITPPQLLRAFATDSLTLTLFFDEPLDSSKAATANNYSVSDGIGVPLFAITMAPIFDRVILKLSVPLLQNKVYTITTNAITDCAGNVIASKNTALVGLSKRADNLDIVINEILYNPKPNQSDYVEIYNRSNKIINLKQTYIANRNAANIISSIKPLSTDDYLFFPQNFMVITQDPSIIKSSFITKSLDAFLAVSPMPSYNIDKGDVIILNGQGNIVDELQYNDSWQFKLIDNTQGVALERIDYNAPTQLQDNWHSAASSVGYGTPTYKNSQYKITESVQGEIKISPEIVSPDNDGIDDFATINYLFPSAGYVANITILDAAGRPVRYLQRNALCGTSGNFNWDGLGEKNAKLPVGIYIIYTQIFNLQGHSKQFKNTIVLARRN